MQKPVCVFIHHFPVQSPVFSPEYIIHRIKFPAHILILLSNFHVLHLNVLYSIVGRLFSSATCLNAQLFLLILNFVQSNTERIHSFTETSCIYNRKPF